MNYHFSSASARKSTYQIVKPFSFFQKLVNFLSTLFTSPSYLGTELASLSLFPDFSHSKTYAYGGSTYRRSLVIFLITPARFIGHIHVEDWMSAAAINSVLKVFHSSCDTLYLLSRGSYAKPDARDSVLVGIQSLLYLKSVKLYQKCVRVVGRCVRPCILHTYLATGLGISAKDTRRIDSPVIEGERSLGAW